MRSVQIDLPDQIADEAQKAGLLLPERMEPLLRQGLELHGDDDFSLQLTVPPRLPTLPTCPRKSLHR